VRPCGVRPQLEQVGLEQHDLEQVVETRLRLGADLDHRDVATEGLGDEAVLGELRARAVRVRVGQVALVDRDDDRDLRGLRVVDRLRGLRLHAVVGGDDEDRDVGDLRTAGAHGGERLVTRRVDEGDRPAGTVHLVRADVLGDATRLGRHDVGGPDGVEQQRLAVVDVTHDRDDRRTW
jgi:hypothetical protein